MQIASRSLDRKEKGTPISSTMPVPTAPSTAIQRHGSVALQARSGSRTPPESEDDDPYNVDEWDPSRGAFWQHAVAGSLAGFAEHSAMFPIDTMKTHMQVRSATTANLYELVSSCGVPRLWRGVQTMFAGCIPAHAAYFSIYETLKPVFTHELEKSVLADRIDRAAGTLGGSTSEAIGAGAAVSVATVAHDVVMTPMDVMKQRLQLGYHDNSMGDAFRAILREQGPRAFVVSLPLTLCINMPYAAVMGTTNETLRKALVAEGEQPSAVTYMTAGGLSGALAAAATAPLDAVKTRLQTQHLAGATTVGAAAAESTAGGGGQPALLYNNAAAAARALYHEGGAAAFYRGVQARMLVHAPAVGLCWTSCECATPLRLLPLCTHTTSTFLAHDIPHPSITLAFAVTPCHSIPHLLHVTMRMTMRMPMPHVLIFLLMACTHVTHVRANR